MLNSQRVNLSCSITLMSILIRIKYHLHNIWPCVTHKKKMWFACSLSPNPTIQKKCSEGCKLTVCPCSNRWAPWCPKIIVPYYSIYCFHVFILEFWHSAVQAPIILAMVKSAAKHTPSVINPILGEGNRKLKLLETGLYTIKVPVHQAQKLWLIYC